MKDFDVCVIGSGAGGAPVAWSLARAGRSVVLLERGPWLRDDDFDKDELSHRRGAHHAKPATDPQRVVLGGRVLDAAAAGWSFRNGNLVGGATNFMSGYFHRMKPVDFRLRSEFGPIPGGDVVDWPIDYDALEPWYAQVEQQVGLSGHVIAHPWAEPRSTAQLPLPPLAVHPLAGWVEAAARDVGVTAFPITRAVLSRPRGSRGACDLSGYCAHYGCTTGAKGSARAAFVEEAAATGRCEVRANTRARRLVLGPDGRVDHVETASGSGLGRVSARRYVIACQPIETARLLLLSSGPGHPSGLGNTNGLVGRNLLFSAGGYAAADFPYELFDAADQALLRNPTPFLDRAIQDDYVLSGTPRRKGGTVDFIFPHPNPIAASVALATHGERLIFGVPLKRALQQYFGRSTHVKAECFADWVPHPGCNVSLDPDVKDAEGLPVARVSPASHPRNREVALRLLERAAAVLSAMRGSEVRIGGAGAASTNLVAGGCRFGSDAETSVLDPECRLHRAPEVFVSDGSFMPTGGSVPYTFTLYANALRVAEAVGRGL